MSWPRAARAHVLCFAEDDLPAVGVWLPEGEEQVMALVCEEHATGALSNGVGKVRRWGERVWHDGLHVLPDSWKPPTEPVATT